jgi:heptosyltransferase-3
LTPGRHALLVRAGALGDVLLLRRAAAALHRVYRRVLLVAPGASGRALVGPGPSEVDELIDWEAAPVARLLVEDAEAEMDLRLRLRDVELAVVYSRQDALVRGLQSIVPRVVAHDPHPAEGLHASEWLARPLAGLGIDLPREVPPMQATGAESAAAAAWLGRLPERFVAVHPGSGSPSKNWPAERFASLLDVLASSGPWLLVEGPADVESAAPLARRPGAVRARGFDPRVLGAVLARAGLFVGHDSGVSHLSAAWGAPTLALFGPTDPAVWGPIGARVSVLRSPGGRLDGLSVEAVAAEAGRRRAT